MKKNLACRECMSAIAKKEAHFVDEGSFSLLTKAPVQEGIYCSTCYEFQVIPHLNAYEDLVEKAKNVNVFFTTQSKESRFVRRTEKPVTVAQCADRDDALLRLAVLAVSVGKNSLVDVELTSEKVMNGRWQSSIWNGTGIPAWIEETALQRRFATAPN